MNWKTTDPFWIYLFCQNFWKICSPTTSLAFVNIQSAQYPAVSLPVRAQHRDCMSLHTQWLSTSLNDNDTKSLAFWTSLQPLTQQTMEFSSLASNTILAKLVLILPFSQELRHPCRWPKINRNVEGLVFLKDLFWACTVHFVYKTTYWPHQKALYLSWNVHIQHNSITLNWLKIMHSLQDCVKDIGLWLEENKLKLNDD